MKIEHMEGRKAGKVMLYALSTCSWCKKTRQLLTDLGVEYDYVYVDLLNEQDQEDVMKIVTKWNPGSSFPTMVIDDSKSILGFDEEAIREAFKL